MGILKTNSAVGAYKSVAEWVKNHFNVGVDLEKLEKYIELKGETYDIRRSADDNWSFSWGLRKLIFKGNQSIQIPSCFSQSFLDRVETVELKNHSKFDPDQIKDFPILRNLKRINCVVSGEDDIYSFLDEICHLAKRIAPENNNIVGVTICSGRMSQLPGGSEFPDFYLSEKFYDARRDEKSIKIGPQLDVKASIVQCNSTIIKYLDNINIESLNELEVCADYFASGAISRHIENNASLKKLVIRPFCTRILEKRDDYHLSIINCHLDLLDIPDDFPITITNSNISGLKELMGRCSRMWVDGRSKIKSGLGVVPVSSQAIDMFGNFIHPNDVVAIPVRDEIKWYKVIDVESENVSVIVSFRTENRDSDKESNYEYIYYTDLLNKVPYKDHINTLMKNVEINGKIRKAYVMSIPDKSCWKIDVSFLEKSDANKFYDESIQMLKCDVSFVPES